MAFDEERLQVHGETLQTYRIGNGSPIVLFHGGGVDSAMLSWSEVARALAPRYRVHLADWPGYGRSPASNAVQSIAFLVRLAEELMEVWGLDRPVVGGISLGGAVALGLALNRPERLGGLVLVDSYGLQDRAPAHLLSYLSIQPKALWSLYYRWAAGSRERTRTLLGAIFHDKQAITDDLVDQVYAAIRQPDAGMAFYSTQLDEIRPNGVKTCYMARLNSLDVPALFIHGEADTAVALRFAREAAGRVPNARLVTIPAAGHWPQRERPEAFIGALLPFLDELPGR